MADDRSRTSGLELLIDKYRDSFRIPENLNHYDEDDFQKAEKKYLHYCLSTGQCR